MKKVLSWSSMHQAVSPESWNDTQFTIDEETKMEDLNIALPSSFITINSDGKIDITQLSKYPPLLSLAPDELQLRQGQAEDILNNIRTLVKKKAWGWKNKFDHVAGQHPSTRAFQKLEAISSALNTQVHDYNRIFKILQRLDPDVKKSPFRELEDGDLKADNAMTAQLALGAGKTRLSWIWFVPEAGDSGTQEEWAIACE